MKNLISVYYDNNQQFKRFINTMILDRFGKMGKLGPI